MAIDDLSKTDLILDSDLRKADRKARNKKNSKLDSCEDCRILLGNCTLHTGL